MSVSNQEEKTDNNEDGLQDLGIPVPVQTFLWGQIAPFIRPKLGKLHEAACMVRIYYIYFPFSVSRTAFLTPIETDNKIIQ